MTKHPLTIYRENAGLSVAALAALADTSRQSIHRIETGKQTPSLGLVARLLKAADGELEANDFMVGVA